MRFLFCVLLTVVCALAQNVRLTWIGQASFMFESDPEGPVVVTDPPAASNGYPLPTRNVNVVTVSHNHADHNFVTGLRGGPILVDGRPIGARQQVNAAGLPFTLLPGFHDNANGSLRGQNTIITWTQQNIKFAHFGDFGQDTLTEAQLIDLAGVDVAFIPGGGSFTTDPARLPAIIRQFNPRVTILMHFRTALGGAANLATFPAVTDPFPDIRYKPSSLVLNKSTLPTSPETWLMDLDTELIATNGAGFTRGMPVSGGSLVSIFGTFTGSGTEAAASLPLPRQLGNSVQVMVGGQNPVPAPLYYVSPGQINFQLPSGIDPSYQAVEVRVGGNRVSRGSVTLLPRAPGLFLVLNQDGSLNTPAKPARRGDIIQIFATGAGPTNPAIADGASAGSDPLARTLDQPALYLNGEFTPVEFSGLTPGTAGVWQINARVPTDTRVGPDVTVVVIHGLASNELRIAVQ